MSFLSRVVHVLLGDRLNREIAEEYESHIHEAVEGGRDPEEARRALGSPYQQWRQRQEGHDARVLPWLDSLRADVVFAWRQLFKRKVATAAAILSLALAMGACASAFRLVNALFLRPLPIANPSRVFAVRFDGISFQGEPAQWDTTSYSHLKNMQAAVKGQAELIGIEYAQRYDLTYGSDQAMEKVMLQHVSGRMFPSFGLRPALGRLFTEDDDHVKGAKPYAIISYQYWKSRFGRDPDVIGRTFRTGGILFQIIGVCEERFTGTEPGKIPDIYLPATMQKNLDDVGNGWLRIFVRVNPGVSVDTVRDQMYAVYRAAEQERAKFWTNIPKELLVGYPREKLLLVSANSGVSLLQKEYRTALTALAVLVLLVLLIACANVGNLMTAQAASRAKELALRLSLGAGQWRLMRMVAVESAMLALISAVLGGAFAAWAAPFVVSKINTPDDPVRLVMTTDWRVLGFGLLLTLSVTLLFGLMPALSASTVKPLSVLKGSENGHSRRRLMHLSIAMQVALCFVVLFLAGLFASTLKKLITKPLGFHADGVLLLTGTAQHAQTAEMWDQVVERLRSTPGVEAASLSSWPLLSGRVENNLISTNGAPPGKVPARFVWVSPDWLGTMKIALRRGRDFRAKDADPQVAIVSRQFAKQFFDGVDPVGKFFEEASSIPGKRNRVEIVGLTDDAAYKDVHDAALPIAFMPMRRLDASGSVEREEHAVFTVRTTNANPLALALSLRQEIQTEQPAIRISNVSTQAELVRGQTIRERLLAALGAFFAAVALLLAGIGLYGVLHFSVLQREREIGIRIALGAATASVARLVAAPVVAVVLGGAVAGLALGEASVKYVETLLYGVKANDPSMLLLPALVLTVASILAALPAIMRAVRIDPAIMLRE